MRVCQVCLHEDESGSLKTCPECGEASWTTSTSANDKPTVVDLGGVTEEKAAAPKAVTYPKRGRR